MASHALKYKPALVHLGFSSKVLRSSFLVTCKQLRVCACACVRVAPPSPHRSTHIPLSPALNNNRKQRGNPRAHFLCVQPAFFTMEQEEPGNWKGVLRGKGGGVTECEGKIKLSFHLAKFSFFPCSPFQVAPFPIALCDSLSAVVYLPMKHTPFSPELFFFFL